MFGVLVELDRVLVLEQVVVDPMDEAEKVRYQELRLLASLQTLLHHLCRVLLAA